MLPRVVMAMAEAMEAKGGGDTKLNLLISVAVPIFVLVCICCCVFQIIRCVCGEVCGGGMDPLIGAGLGAVAGYEMGQYEDQQKYGPMY